MTPKTTELAEKPRLTTKEMVTNLEAAMILTKDKGIYALLSQVKDSLQDSAKPNEKGRE